MEGARGGGAPGEAGGVGAREGGVPGGRRAQAGRRLNEQRRPRHRVPSPQPAHPPRRLSLQTDSGACVEELEKNCAARGTFSNCLPVPALF